MPAFELPVADVPANWRGAAGRVFIPLCVFVCVATAASGSALAGESAKRLNVVVIVADDLGWSDLACYGSDLHETPFLDRLARQSLRFTNAYSAASVCTPTRAALMTGKAPARLGMTIWHEASNNPPQDRQLIPPVTQGNLPLAETTLAEIFRAAGYHTVHIGKWHLGDAAHYPENQGFDVNIGGTFWGAPPTFFSPYRGPFGRSREPRYVPGLHGGPPGEYLTDRLTNEALKILDTVKDQPFFLHLCYHAVHTPIEAKPQLVEHYRSRLRPGMKHRNPTYAGMVHTLDENVGRLLGRLEEWGIAEQTVVIFTSDNGGFINAHRDMPAVTNNAPLRSGKGSLYEGGIRVPLMIRWPGRTTAGTECDEPVVTMDLFATLAATLPNAGESIVAGEQDGVSLLPLLADPQSSLAPRPLYFHYPHYYPTTSPVGAIRSGDWKLLEFFEEMRVELYNLRDDLGETHDLAARRPEQAARLRQELHQWRDRLHAQMPALNTKAER